VAVLLYVAPPDDAPEHVREGLARRRIVECGGQCPCGARLVMPNRAARRRSKVRKGIVVTNTVHENDCPAADPTLGTALRQWHAARF
jgi:hypothetical protein